MIIGHQTQWKFLKSMAEAGRLPHALLFSGQSQLGKKTLAVEFAKLLIIGEKKIDRDPFSIRMDREWVSIQSEPDFILIEPRSNKSEIQISQIRELIWKLSLRPYSAPLKVALIDQAHQMNREAQNCFLKTLEEPKGKALLILITEHPELLASTILSRVQKLKFFPVQKSEIEKYLLNQGVSQERAEYLSFFSLGRPGRAINFLEDEQKIKNQEKLISDLEKISQSDFSFRFQYAKDLSGGDFNIKEILDTWLNHFRNLLFSKLAEANPLQSCRGLASASSVSVNYDLFKIKKIINSIQSTDYLISTTNINPKLAFEILLMEL